MNKPVPLWPAWTIPILLLIIKPELTAAGIIISLIMSFIIRRSNEKTYGKEYWKKNK